MNWYKKAQRKNRLSELLKGLSIGSVLGLMGWLGFSNMVELQNNYVHNPQVIEQKIVEYQNNSQEQIEPQIELQQNFDYNRVAEMIEKHEGKRDKVYSDTLNNPTIGIGFNLNRYDAREKIEALGLSYDEIKKGNQSLTDKQIYSLFKDNLNEAINISQSFLPNFNEHPAKIQEVIIDMAFNLGSNKLAGFKKFREALLNKDYKVAADEMINSEWYGQVGNRSIELENIMQGIM